MEESFPGIYEAPRSNQTTYSGSYIQMFFCLFVFPYTWRCKYWIIILFHYLGKDHTCYFLLWLSHFTFPLLMYKDTFNYLLPIYFNYETIFALFQEDDLNETLKSLYNQPVPKANMPVNLSVVRTFTFSLETILSHLRTHACSRSYLPKCHF